MIVFGLFIEILNDKSSTLPDDLLEDIFSINEKNLVVYKSYK